MSNVGRMLYGYCNGFFGRDSYRDKRIEGEGVDWIVAREGSEPVFASFESETQKQSLLSKWATQPS